ncbi:acyl carrier protein [Bacillus solitudinis]|uniref:acyl carrier protein n=1 Tax=Bacillus solitudinis TaxID=2014074 RepID=UPI0012FD567A|nr:phosphopantetheine-binding protein [Bacillus solitudinis]
MTVDNLREVISEIANIPLKEIHEQSSFKDDLDIDSLQMVNLILEITTRFGIQLTSIESNEDLATVGNLYRSLLRGY